MQDGYPWWCLQLLLVQKGKAQFQRVYNMSFNVGILLIRVLFGVAMAAHGAQKMFGWFGGPGLNRTGGLFEGLGFRPGVPFAAAAGLSETRRRHSIDAWLVHPVRRGSRSRGDARGPERSFKEWILCVG